MSSFVRTLQKQMLKRMGYHRQKVSVSEVAGVVMSRRLKKGEGPILKPDGESTGNTFWPKMRPSIAE